MSTRLSEICVQLRITADPGLTVRLPRWRLSFAGSLTGMEQTENIQFLSRSQTEVIMNPDKRGAWLQKIDEECPYQVVLPRRQLTDDNEIMNFLLLHAGKFDMYVEDECAAYVRYCFKDPMDAAIFRSRFEAKSEPFRRAG